ncbi:hypothetical protein HY251_08305 [bacterium]|nr:hypothetical protein [bacterium]
MVLAAIVVGSPLVLRLSIECWASYRLSAFDAFWQRAIKNERERVAARRSPVLRGVASDDDAAPRYKGGLSVSIDSKEERLLILGEAEGRPNKPVPILFPVLERHRTELANLREALHCTRCDWKIAYEDGSGTPGLPDPGVALWLGSLLIVEGHERALSGDPKGAAERYLDAARFGADFALGPEGMFSVGTRIQRLAFLALDQLVVETPTDAPLPLDEIDRQLALLDEDFQRADWVVHMERLMWLGIAELAARATAR